MSNQATAETLDAAPRTALGRPFPKGTSGNPSGRPKRLAELHSLSQVNFPIAVQRLAELIKSRDEELAFRAIQFVFLYILGKPPEATALMQQESLRARLTELVVQPQPQLQEPVESASPSEEAPKPSDVAGAAAVLTPEPPVPTEALTGSPPPSEAPSGFVMTPEREALLERIRGDEKPAGLRCLFHGKDGQCGELAQDGAQWCGPHRAKLFEVLK